MYQRLSQRGLSESELSLDIVLFLESTVHFDSYTLDTPSHTGMPCRIQSVLDLFICGGMHASFVRHRLRVPCDREVHMVVRRKAVWESDGKCPVE